MSPKTLQNRFSPKSPTSISLDSEGEVHPATHKRAIWLRFVAFPYYGPLHYYTIDPMAKICEKQDDLKTTIKLLCLFKSRKHEEITFIRIASTLSAAASIGSLSWPDISTSLWAAKYFLVISLYMSIFALVGTAALRQLDYFPNTTTATFNEREVHAMLSLILDFPQSPSSSTSLSTSTSTISVLPQTKTPGIKAEETDCEASTIGVPDGWCHVRGVPSRYKQYFWQVSMMLMSGSWLTYLVGVLLYVITPLTRMDSWSTDGVASAITFFFAIIIAANFLITNNRAFSLLDSAKQRGLREDSELATRDKGSGW